MSKYRVKLIVEDTGKDCLRILKYIRNVILNLKNMGIHIQIIKLTQECLDDDMMATLARKGISHSPTLITENDDKIVGYPEIKALLEAEIRKFNSLALRSTISGRQYMGGGQIGNNNLTSDMNNTPIYGNFDGELGGYMASLGNEPEPEDEMGGGHSEALPSDGDFSSHVSQAMAHRDKRNAVTQPGRGRSRMVGGPAQPQAPRAGPPRQNHRLPDNITDDDDDRIPQGELRRGMTGFMAPPPGNGMHGESSQGGFAARAEDAEDKFDAAFRDKMDQYANDDGF